ncbi:2OG-Fe dioxygenase family protein [Pseudomarimonas arenosa]|uniref:2OG-Fe dioxygenase family protein n=1 Tax=Pseudomarimonas arenosa TaxID=2774145 RepID=A0AAW3ZIS8_9GAMM|nr:2OG-Fe dioxygenase family protein [Pseudomarimonas arenosa]MBD8525683.1 2OG-Fe dioxygenase family protein [Pseudomarimonas arenosa]
MQIVSFPPWQLGGADAAALIQRQGFAVLDAEQLATLPEQPQAAELARLAASWQALPHDPHLLDGGRYRQRRHASIVLDEQLKSWQEAPRRAHWQPIEYNALHGGIERWFEPIEPALLQTPSLQRLVSGLAQLFSRISDLAQRYVELHQFRITTEGGIGRPTPEGAHRDGVDFVVVILVQRHQVKGGETRVFDASGPAGLRFTMQQPWSALLLDDRRVIHETTPLQPLADAPGWRDTLVITFRSAGFLQPQTE